MSAKSIVLVAIGVVSMYCATIWAHTESGIARQFGRIRRVNILIWLAT